MHVNAPNDWNTCQKNCEDKANELGIDGCCEARGMNGYCVFHPQGRRDLHGYADAKAVLCSSNYKLLDAY